jgi:hypothetical protein
MDPGRALGCAAAVLRALYDAIPVALLLATIVAPLRQAFRTSQLSLESAYFNGKASHIRGD